MAPTTKIKQLGFVVDSKICTFSAPTSKLAEIRRDGSVLLGLAFRQARLVKAKLLARFLGKIAFLGLAIRPAKFFTRNLHRALASKRDWRSLIRLSRPALKELNFWLAVPQRFVSTPFQRVPHQVVLATDASLRGWGACLTEPSAPPPPPSPALARGFWTAPERLMHINVLELEAVLQAVRTFWSRLAGRQVQLAMDS